jgi:hypothetical protein
MRTQKKMTSGKMVSSKKLGGDAMKGMGGVFNPTGGLSMGRTFGSKKPVFQIGGKTEHLFTEEDKTDGGDYNDNLSASDRVVAMD